MKKKLFFLLALIMPLLVSAETVEINSIWYNLNEETLTAEVTNKVGGDADRWQEGRNTYSVSKLTIPSSVRYNNKTYSVKSIGGYAFYGCSKLTSVTIPSSVTTIAGELAFAFSGITSITIPNSVTTIGKNAFRSCESLTSITLHDGITDIGEYAFTLCKKLKSFTIPAGLTKLNNYLFWQSGLTSITIPATVTKMGLYVFQTCRSLALVISENTNPISIEYDVFKDVEYNCVLKVPAGTKDLYKARGWTGYIKNIEAIAAIDQSLDYSTIPQMTYGSGNYTLPETTAEGMTLTWSVENTNIATVEANVLTVKGAGSTTVTATQAGNDEFNSFSREFTLTVNKATLTITANNKSMIYGDDVPTFDVTYSGFKNDDTSAALTSQPTATSTATKNSVVGTYSIIPSGGSSDNYMFDYVDGTLTINKAPLTITAKSYTINEKDDMPTFNATYEGFKNGQNASYLSTLPTLTCTATDTETPGIYTITPSGAAATNYSFNYVSGTLTIDAVTSVSITLNSLGKGTYCSKFPLDFTNVSGIYAYIISGFKPSAGNLIVTRVYEVPAGTGLYIVGTPGNTYTIPIAPTDFYYSNMMKGITVATVIPANEDGYTNYVLASNGNGGAIFKRANNTQSPANRAYVQIPSSTAGAREFLGIELDDDSTTGLDGVITSDTEEAEGDYYNLSGQKVQTPRKGIYIKNGKKIFIH